MSVPPPLSVEQKLAMALDDIIAYEARRASAMYSPESVSAALAALDRLAASCERLQAEGASARGRIATLEAQINRLYESLRL